MPTVLRYMGYRIYFWSNENNEGVHVHVCKGDSTENATKIAICKDGGIYKVHNKSKVPTQALIKLGKYILANKGGILEAWYSHFGYIKFDY